MIRLSDNSVAIIKKLFTKNFRNNDNLWIFGSRVCPEKKGGDIDLYIETNALNPREALDMRMKFEIDLIQALGEQKIDIVLNLKNFPYQLVIYEYAKNQGIKLI